MTVLAAGFEIFPLVGGGFKLRDTDKVNDWGELHHVFSSEQAAADFAWAVKGFKEGRTSRLEWPP